ncbi:hypothetical protein ES703_72346 [subsurface metagenome]
MIRELDEGHIVHKGGIYVVALSKNYSFDAVQNLVIDNRNNKRLPYDINSKILIYEDRQKTWFFEIADCLKLMNEAGFIILMIAVSYLEANQQFREGESSNRDSMNTIGRALKRIFPELKEEWFEKIIDGARNGLFHSGITKKGVLISGNPKEVFTELQSNLIINPHLFLDSIKKDYEDYIQLLKNPSNSQERINFEKFWDTCGGFDF